jgi:Na+/H+ antiporter NhaC
LTDLQLGNVVAGHLKAQDFPAQWLPLGVFVSAAVISFATGTSWGTMAILCPMTVDIGVRLIAGIEQPEALHLFYASVGSVLAGAVFGDHCSPISDTTVLSSIASGCRHEEHVWTQIPYALLAAIASMGLGDVLCSVYQQPWYVGLGAGAIFLILALLLFGRQAQPSLELADA